YATGRGLYVASYGQGDPQRVYINGTEAELSPDGSCIAYTDNGAPDHERRTGSILPIMHSRPAAGVSSMSTRTICILYCWPRRPIVCGVISLPRGVRTAERYWCRIWIRYFSMTWKGRLCAISPFGSSTRRFLLRACPPSC